MHGNVVVIEKDEAFHEAVSKGQPLFIFSVLEWFYTQINVVQPQ